MTRRTKRLLITAMTLGVICISIAGWSAVKVVAWARGLPNRIVIDGDGLADAFGAAVVQSYHEGLINGDTPTQSQIIRDFTALVENNVAAQRWVRTEYANDLRQLTLSPNADVAALAGTLLTLLPESPDPVQCHSTDQGLR
ncbi:hypothetical protein Pla52o_49980 [Novipirellula galeiformis]|uniref:Uncharacterized protein n=1 Tax=Novipirellula galeiformis TaxID=2528004 RepID=A0A5C6BZT9_9BACT|nr:hypothetical protein [Novipirellula galeiformis]TWU17783.1 hypothetical protein Pla52o_49980 [Novipirellula galeiformis]